MPRLESFKVRLTTGNHPLQGKLGYSINGFPLEFDEVSGTTEPGGVLEAVGHPESFPHTLQLNGPESGEWEIAGLEVEYTCAGEEAYTVRMGGVTLDERADLNLWTPRPPKVIDV